MRVKQLPACLFTLLWICPTYAQEVSVGLVAGVPITGLLKARDADVSETSRYTFGPDVQVSLPRDFALEVNLLYKRAEFGFRSDPARAIVRRLELPVQLRYLLPGSQVRPWIQVGMSFNRVLSVANGACGQGGSDERFFCVAGATAAVMRHRSTNGPVLGGGLEFRKGRLQVDPQIRVTRWVDRNFGTRDSALQAILTQVEVLVGARF
jgi:hypothetical protein